MFGSSRGINSSVASWSVVDDDTQLAQRHISPWTDHEAKQNYVLAPLWAAARPFFSLFFFFFWEIED